MSDDVIDLEERRKLREVQAAHGTYEDHEAGAAFAFAPFEFNELESVGIIHGDLPIVVLTSPEELYGVVMSRDSAIKLGRALLEAAQDDGTVTP